MADIRPVDDREERELHQLRALAQEILAILQQAQNALEDLKRENDLDALAILRRIQQLDEQAIHEILQAQVSIVASREREALILLEREMNEIKILASEAEQVLMKGKRRKAKRLLARLISIGKKAEENQRRFSLLVSSPALVGYSLAIDGYVTLWIWKKWFEGPTTDFGKYIDGLLHKIEVTYEQVVEVKEKALQEARKIQKSPGKVKNKIKHVWDKAGEWTKDTLDISLPGAREPEVMNARELSQRMAAEAQKGLQHTTTTLGPPPPLPPQMKNYCENWFPTIVLIALGWVMIKYVLRYQWRWIMKRRTEQRIAARVGERIVRMYPQVRSMTTQLDMTGKSVAPIADRLDGLQQQIAAINARLEQHQVRPEMLDDISRILEELTSSRRTLIEQMDRNTALMTAHASAIQHIVKEEIAAALTSGQHGS